MFPIPDGDTGDNMFLTINAGATAAGEGSENLSQTAGKAASGMLLGARGNSGVILSRIFAGLAKGFEGVESADAAALGKAFESGVKEAYGAVSVPVEGTILTVLKDSVALANGKILPPTARLRAILPTSTASSGFAGAHARFAGRAARRQAWLTAAAQVWAISSRA